jgi:O-antigen/teichoic acid export membrane protein
VRFAATQADQVVAAAVLPAPALAGYYLLRRIYSCLVLAVDSTVDVLIPRLSREGVRRPPFVVRGWHWLGLAAGLGAVTLLAFVGDGLAGTVLGSAYASSAVLIPPLAIAGLAYAAYSLALAVETVAGSPSHAFRCTALAAVTSVGAALGLSHVFSVAGLPMAMALGYATGTGAAIGRPGGLWRQALPEREAHPASGSEQLPATGGHP